MTSQDFDQSNYSYHSLNPDFGSKDDYLEQLNEDVREDNLLVGPATTEYVRGISIVSDFGETVVCRGFWPAAVIFESHVYLGRDMIK
jgi:hypothetical protein